MIAFLAWLFLAWGFASTCNFYQCKQVLIRWTAIIWNIIFKACTVITINDSTFGAITKKLEMNFLILLCLSRWHSDDDETHSHGDQLVHFCFFQQADETLDFEEQILEAAKSIAAATSALVKSASAAQRELVAQGKVSQHDYSHSWQDLSVIKERHHIPLPLFQVGSSLANAEDDGQWSQGLISAVRFLTLLFGSRLTEEPV